MDNINFNDIDKINMTYLLNKQYTIKKKIHTSNTIVEKKDVKFYKKRIIDISKKIINNDLEKCEKNKQLIDTFHLFASKCIDYFETTDKNDNRPIPISCDSGDNNPIFFVAGELPIAFVIAKFILCIVVLFILCVLNL